MADIVYRDDAGKSYVGYLELPEKPNGAALLIAHSAPGVGNHERTVAARLAGLGYVALAADLHGDGQTLDNPQIALRLREAVSDPETLRRPLQSALLAVQQLDGVEASRVAAIGYCFGGQAVLEFAQGGGDVASVVAFHSLLPKIHSSEARSMRASVLVQNGTQDPYCPPEMRTAFEDAMNAAGAEWRMILYGNAEHAYTMADARAFNMEGVAYHAQSDARSWRAMLDHFGETIGPPIQ